MNSLDQLEQALAGRTAQTVTVDGFKFMVRSLDPVHFEAARRVGLARARTEPLPDGLDGSVEAHAEAWRMVCISQEVAVEAVEAWPLEDEITPEAMRRFIRLAPDGMVNKLYAAAAPRLMLSDEKAAEAGNA